MADEQAKNSANLGELFVEFGSKGMGGLIKGLNSVSASFLLTKNAGQQMLQPLANMSKQAGQGVVALDKLNSVTGISVKQLYRLKQWTKLNNIDFNDYIGQIHSLQNAILNFSMGNQEQLMMASSLLGIDPAAFDYNKPLRNLEIVKKAMLKMYKERGEAAKPEIANALRILGLNEELAYTMLRANKEVDNRLKLTDRETNALREQNDAWKELSVTVETFFTKSIAKIGLFAQSIRFLNSLILDLFNPQKGIGVLSGIASGAILGASVGSLAGPIGTGIGAIVGGIGGAVTGHTIMNNDGKPKPAQHQKPKPKISNAVGGYTDEYLMELNEKDVPQAYKKRYEQLKNNAANITPPSMATSGTPNVTRNNVDNRVSYEVNIHQEITGTDSLEIADNSISGIENTMIQLKYGNIG